jgi:hypothetical protein
MTQSGQNRLDHAAPLSDPLARTEPPATQPRWSSDVAMPLSVRIHANDPSFATLHDIVARRPEAHLALGVLVDAIVCFTRYAWSTSEPKRILFREAQRWLSGDVPNSSRFTCGFICDSLGIDRTAVTETLLAWHTHESIRRCRRTVVWESTPRSTVDDTATALG